MRYACLLASFCLIAALCFGGSAAAQTLEDRGFQPVQQLAGDTDPLQADPRRVEGGLGYDGGGQSTFVYRRRGAVGESSKLYYLEPGVIAEYDRSDYGLFEVDKDEFRIFQLIPPNTLFHTSLPPVRLAGPAYLSPIGLAARVDARVDATPRVRPSRDSPQRTSTDIWDRYNAMRQIQKRAVLAALEAS